VTQPPVADLSGENTNELNWRSSGVENYHRSFVFGPLGRFLACFRPLERITKQLATG